MSCFMKTTQIIAALLTAVLFAVLTGCSTSAGPAEPVLAATSGTGQAVPVQSPFSSPFTATVTVNGQPLANASVIFTSTSQEPGCVFNNGNGTYTETDTTNASGVATSSVCAADVGYGSYNVAATVLTAAGADFTISNTLGTASTITPTSGSGQSATVDTAFASPLVVTVKDQDGIGVIAAPVTFTAPAMGASGTFANGTATETDSTASGASGSGTVQGEATSSTFTANGTTGIYTVTATIPLSNGNLVTVDFTLTNTAAGGGSRQ